MSTEIRLAAEPSAGVPRRSSFTLWSLEEEQEFQRTRLAERYSSVFDYLLCCDYYLIYRCNVRYDPVSGS